MIICEIILIFNIKDYYTPSTYEILFISKGKVTFYMKLIVK